MYEFEHFTDWIPDKKESLLSLLNEMVSKKNEFLKFVQLFNTIYKGVNIEFYELDADVGIVKWKITFSPLLEEKTTVHFRGYSLETFYKLADKSSGEEVFFGNLTETANFCDNHIKDMSDDEFVKKYEKWENVIFDKYKEWTKDVSIVTFSDNH